MSKSNTHNLEEKQTFNDSDYGYIKEVELEIVKKQIQLWRLRRIGQQETLDLAEKIVDETDSQISKLTAKRMMLEAEIDAERMGHPLDQ